MKTSLGYVNIISAYAPTVTSTPEAKDQFYEALEDVLSGISNSEAIYLLGNFNAHIWAHWQAWPTCLSHQGIGRMNNNRQRLLKLCCHNCLCITNSYITSKEMHKVFWRHPQSCHWHQLDLIITRRADLSTILHMQSYHSADCNTDHSLIASKVRLKPRKIHYVKTKGFPRIKTCSTSDPTKVQSFANNFKDRLAMQPPPGDPGNPVATWNHLRNAIYDSAKAVFRKKEHNNADWFKAH